MIFTDPIAQVVFTSPKSKKEWFFQAPDFPFLTGVTLAYEMARKATLQLTFDIPYENALDPDTGLLSYGTPFTLGTHVKARIGYASKPDWWTAWFGGFLNAGGDGLALDPNGLTGTISVQVISEGAEYTISEEKCPFTDPNPVTMLTACTQAMGEHMSISISPDANTALNLMSTIMWKGGKPDPDQKMWSPEGYLALTAWEAIKKICTFGNLKYWIGSDPGDPTKTNTIYIATEAEVSMGLVYGQKKGGEKADPGIVPQVVFRMRGAIDIDRAEFPCLTWAPEGGGASATWLAAGDDQTGKGVLLAYIDSDTGVVVEIPATPDTQQVATVGPQPAIQQDLKVTDADGTQQTGDAKKQDGTPAVVISAPMPPGEGGKQRAQALANKRQSAGNPAGQGVITSIGLPWVIPPLIVGLAGCGDIYNGPYMVQKATHTWTGGNYEMSLTCLRRGQGQVEPETEKVETPVGPMPDPDAFPA